MTIPLFVSAPTSADYHGFDKGQDRVKWPSWAFDSGAYSALSPQVRRRNGAPWDWDPDSYGGMVVRLVEAIGIPPIFAAIQDLPCEPEVLKATGLDTETHQELTIGSYLHLTREFYFVCWAPTLQGWLPHDYIRHMTMYESFGVNLSEAGTVCMGSLCRRGSAKPVIAAVEAVQAHAWKRYGRLLPLHGFGVNIIALRSIGHLLASSDSMAWSATARRARIRLPECTHRSRWCNNCPRYALQWRERVLAAIGKSEQMASTEHAPAA